MKKLNWRYAIGEFLIVVAGIFVAFELQTFSKSRQRHKDSVSYHKRLIADVELDIEIFERTRETSKSMLGVIINGLNALKSNDLPDSLKSDFDHMINYYSRFEPVNMNATTYNEMVSSGKLDLIENIDLRSSLGKYANQIAGISNLADVFIDGVEEVTFYMDQYVYTNISMDSNTPSSEYDFSAMARDQHLINSMSRIAVKWSVVNQFAEYSLDLAKQLKNQIEEELE